MATPKKAKIVMRRLDFDYKPGKVNLINDGRSLMSMIPPGSTFRVSGKADSECTLQYAVFHSPSEHVFTDANGESAR
jgi:carbonic anhydrase